MAFATQNVQKSYFGNLKITYGDWTGSVNDVAGTIAVEGGRVYLAEFTDQDGSQPYQIEVPVSVSSSNAITTVTVYNQSTVTLGRFIIVSA